MAYRIGIDAGSKTVKALVISEDNQIVASAYRRHSTAVKESCCELMRDLIDRFGDVSGSVAITGSSSIALSNELDIPFVQEVISVSHAVRNTMPQADVVIELGGEDAKLVFLSGTPEQRMNATCAGGTGGFIDTIASLLGISSQELGELALEAKRIYPIASRCAVFAQSDLRPLLNAGAQKADIAASALDAVVRQTIGGLACGRPVSGTVVFLGGPFEHLPALTDRFRSSLNLNSKTGIKPKDAHLFTALGAALLSDQPERLQQPCVVRSLRELEATLRTTADRRDELPHLSPLFASEGELSAFRARHGAERLPRTELRHCEGPLYLGIDAGSTALKLAAINEAGEIAYADYRPISGDVLKAAQKALLAFLDELSQVADSKAPDSDAPDKQAPNNQVADNKTASAQIAHVCVTGYGEGLLIAALHIDSGVVETTAHLRAARAFAPEVDFVLDIGGQDMKALWVKNGSVDRSLLNTACSSGCGAFIESSAHAIKLDVSTFAEQALRASRPVDLGSRCTVFMNSRVAHAQNAGATRGDIAAGVAYSVVHNALFKTIGLRDLNELGSTIVVQGGPFSYDAVLRAFELVLGKRVLRPDASAYMGAYGAALTAHMRAEEGARSSLLSRDEIASIAPHYQNIRCLGCENACSLSVARFSGERVFITGNRCERAWTALESSLAQAARSQGGQNPSPCAGARKHRPFWGKVPRSPQEPTDQVPNTVRYEQKLLARYGSATHDNPAHAAARSAHPQRASRRIGLAATLSDYETLPFWYTLLAHLGFSVQVARRSSDDPATLESIPSESVCRPAKLAHERIYALAELGVDAVFMPEYERSVHCPVSSSYARALCRNVPLFTEGNIDFLSPRLLAMKPAMLVSLAEDRAAVSEVLKGFVGGLDPLSDDELDQAFEAALAEQQRFDALMKDACARALAWIEAGDERHPRHGIVLAGRPYHIDPALSHTVDSILTALGFAVISPRGLEYRRSSGRSPNTFLEDVRPSEEFAIWKLSKRFRQIAQYVVQRDDLDMVCLHSFGCGFDYVSLEEARVISEKTGHPFTVLQIDEMTDTAHIHIRLRTLADTIFERRRLRHTELVPFTMSAAASSSAAAGSTATNSAVAVSSATVCEDSKLADFIAAVPKGTVIELGQIEPEDIECARRYISSDVCSTAATMTGRVIRLCQENDSLRAVIVPNVCDRCMIEAIPNLVQTSIGRSIEVILRTPRNPEQAIHAIRPDGLHLRESESGTYSPNTQSDAQPITQPDTLRPAGTKPLIGLIGNPLLLLNPCMNDKIVDQLHALDCRVAFPDILSLYTDDVRYLDQLDTFESCGVDHVIYLQSFGCLKGHVDSRGAMREIQQLHPNLPVTILDYDPDASALNRRNRILLAVSAAREHALARSGL